MTKYEFIGTGSGLNPVLGNTSFLVNKNLLIDCGFTVPMELIKKGKLQDITDVAITHLHSDHVGGLEGFGFMNYFAYKRHGADKPNLYLPSNEMAQSLWNILRESMTAGQWWTPEIIEMCQNNKNDYSMMIQKGLESGLFEPFGIDKYFNVHIGKEFDVSGTHFRYHPTLHAPFMENYGLRFGKDGGVFYSGDTIEKPPNDPLIIFQDCQFFEGGVHISYDRLNKELSPEVKSKTHLVHLGGGWDKKDPKADGFAGFVMPGDSFNLEV